MLLPRQHLSLSCIDFGPSLNDASPSRFFESHVKILDLESRLESIPSVLIARSESRGTVHVLERQDNGLYVACQLGPWVDLGDLERKATAVSRDRLHPAKADRPDHDASGQAMTTPQLHKDHKRKRAAIEAIQTLVKKRARSQSVSTLGDATKRDENNSPNLPTPQSQLPSPDLKPEQHPEPRSLEDVPPALPALSSTPAEDRVPQQTQDSIFDSIRNHYFDTLYRSMVSSAQINSARFLSNKLVGLPCILCKRATISGSVRVSFGLGSQSRYGRLDRFSQEPCPHDSAD